jgi:hypothetical protein
MKLLIIFLLILPLVVSANAGISINFPAEEINQGSLQDVRLIIDEESFSKLDSLKLMGLTIEETLYIHAISAFTRKSPTLLETSATVVFIKVPKKNSGNIETPKGKIEVTWENIKVKPIEAPQGFLFGDFDVPKAKNIFVWLISFFILTFFIFLGIKLKNKRHNKLTARKTLDILKNQIRTADDYDAIVTVWKNKHEILRCFPGLHNAFTNLEKELFRVQFKPVQSDLEKDSIGKTYRKFLEEIKGDLDGI